MFDHPPFFFVDVQLLYEAIRRVNAYTFNVADAARNVIDNNRFEFVQFFESYQANAEYMIEKTRASGRSEHSEWFEGIPDTLTTKEDVMARRSQDRIRGYFYKAKDELVNSNIYRTNAHVNFHFFSLSAIIFSLSDFLYCSLRMTIMT